MSNPLIKTLYYHISRPVPTSGEAWELLYQKLVSWYGLPDSDGTRHAISTMVMQLPQHQETAPLKIFVKAIKKQMANEAAYDVITELREKQKQAAASVATKA
jgi:hypothetical protein